MDELRKCTRCEQMLPVSQFSKSVGGRDGLHSYCKACVSEYGKLRSAGRPKAQLESRKCGYCEAEFVPKNRINYYCSSNCKQRARYWRTHRQTGRTCQECGESIDHRRNDAVFCSNRCAQRTLRRERPHIRRKTVLKNQYGLTLEEYDLILNSQGGGCAICGTTEVRGFGKKMAVDHCHDSGRVRGILCGNCNRGLGHFAHDPERLRKAISYLTN